MKIFLMKFGLVIKSDINVNISNIPSVIICLPIRMNLFRSFLQF